MQRAILILAVMILIFPILVAQERSGIHKIEYQKNFIPQLEKSSDPTIPLNIKPLKISEQKELSRSVFGYLPYWEYATSKSYLRYDLLSHIALFSFSLNSSGSISNPPGGAWPWIDVIDEAHDNGVKVVMCVINFDISQQEMHNILTEETRKLNFINSVKSKINAYNLDGVNIDFEASNITTSDRGANINNFMKELTDSVHAMSPELEVSYASPAVNWGNYWDLTGLANSCDYLFVMGYDFFGSWSDVTGPTAPLTGGSYNITNTIDQQYITVSNFYPEKLILGVPYYGPHWIAISGSEGASVRSFEGAERFRNAQPLSEIHGLKWSNNYKNSWYTYLSGSDNHQVWFDSDSSLSLKYDLAIDRNLKGVGMWALGYDGTRIELWNLIDQKFGSGELHIPSEFSVVVLDPTTVELKFASSENAWSYDIYSSSDGQNFTFFREVSTNYTIIDNLETLNAYYYKIRAKNSSGESIFTEVLGCVPAYSNLLIVNGFDRIQNTDNTFDFIQYHSQPLINSGIGYSSCSNESVFNDCIDLDDYDIVFWMLLDESTADETFNQIEQDKVKSFLENGGKLFVSGAEIGWDLVANGNSSDKNFYSNYLKANYISDAPQNQSGTHYNVNTVAGQLFEDVNDFMFDNGTHGTIDVDWPDAIEGVGGASNLLEYDNVPTSSGFAGISYSGPFGSSFFHGQLVHFSFPYETVYSLEARKQLISNILEFFEAAISVKPGLLIANKLELYQNYPNPFNPSTVIKYRIPDQQNTPPQLKKVQLKIYDLLGREVSILVNELQNPGEYKIIFDVNSLGRKISSGTYIYKLQYGDLIQTNKMLLIK